MKLRLVQATFADLLRGQRFYERQEAGLGRSFISQLQSDIEALTHTWSLHRRTHRNYQRVLSRVFPYAVYYTADETEIVIWAIVDCRRSPDWIRARLQ